MELFSAKNIVKKYATHTALDDVSIAVPEKSIFGLLGPNGAGKTSLIRIINQITGPDSGELFFAGKKLLPEHIEQIGYLPEERGLYKKMEVGEQVLYLAQLKGLSRSEASRKLKYWFEKFEIQAWWNKKVEELSKGMQQKVQFIVTILHEPRLLILDEPFSGFDPINANLIKNEILELKAKGTTIIFSTHNMGSVEELCDEIALINKSKKILDGNVKAIRKANATNTYQVEFRGNMIAFTNALWAGFELTEKSQHDDICKATVKMLNNATPNDVLATILPHVQVISFNEVIPTMNDIFISKVNAGQQQTAAVGYTE
ncbi:MAG: ATP-binding cassette domain-containing protein [Bacteroidetes bacterium]|nr:ATP-binding cassette domain-containing protein [Bacteroidota bacterium]